MFAEADGRVPKAAVLYKSGLPEPIKERHADHA
jgi:hypothetical protein